ncbi:hypothetical protein J6590_063000 [Homalodisca vitripennis]|nr:hypothetical protein J6590_063000 [Homalodisca vitripennis]
MSLLQHWTTRRYQLTDSRLRRLFCHRRHSRCRGDDDDGKCGEECNVDCIKRSTEGMFTKAFNTSSESSSNPTYQAHDSSMVVCWFRVLNC